MNFALEYKPLSVKEKIDLPSSKSITNRLLIIQALSKNEIVLENISSSDDTRHLMEALQSAENLIDIGHAGTSMRFLTSFYSLFGKEITLTGSERMQNRPIAVLVNALNQLGAEIEYLEKEGYPPLRIKNKIPHSNKVSINGGVSSQYISSLLLIAPYLQNGLELTLTGKMVSIPYIQLTLSIMKHFGVEHTWEENLISIAKQEYKAGKYFIESDWSGASYWYEIMALSDMEEIRLTGLINNSLQGDSQLVSLFEQLGVETLFQNNTAILTKNKKQANFFEYNFNEQPDIAQTFAVTLCLKAIPFHFYGLETLKIKETDRITALINELAKLGFKIIEPQHGELAWEGEVLSRKSETIEIETYNDHRMALAFAPAAIILDNIVIKDAQVVTKSYPEFWEHIQKIGIFNN